MRRTTALRATLLVAAVTMACSEPTSPLDLVGTYTLQSVNSMPLPFTLQETLAWKVELLDDVLFLASSSNYSSVGHKRYTSYGVVSLAAPVDAGTFSRRGDVIAMQSLLVGRWDGTIQGRTLTLVQQGYTLVYSR
ncbi:MAG: hypothetical protein Q8K55_06485 [Gemmatimonadaceae bacterium]|nr:hypothetical protein [Gemmatimonadaceae bacterium]